MDKVAGIILAGGQSSRMGTNKALLQYQGVALVDHMRALLRDAGLTEIYISGGVPGYDGLADRNPYHGPAPAMRDLLHDFQSRYDRLLIVPVDMPLLDARALRGLMEARGSVFYAGHPLPACIAANSYDAVTSVKALLEQAGARSLSLPDDLLAGMANINTQQQWKAVSG